MADENWIPHPEQDDASAVETEKKDYDQYEQSRKESRIVNNAVRRYRHYRDKRNDWHQAASEDLAFFNLRQWESWEEEELDSRGQAPLIADQIRPRILHLVSELTAQMPEFRVTAQEDSDVRIASVFNDLIQHILAKNAFDETMSLMVKDHCIYGVGAILVEYNPSDENGENTIEISTVHPFDLYVDPESKEPDNQDAERIIVGKNISKNKAMLSAPNRADDIRKLAEGEKFDQYQNQSLHDEEDMVLLDEVRDENKETLLYLEEYTKINIKYYDVYNTTTGDIEEGLTEEQFERFKEDGAIQDGVESGVIQTDEYFKVRVLKRVVIGDILIGEEVLETSKYPIIPLYFEHQRNPFSMGAIRGMKSLQKERNKRRSLMIAHATASTNNKLLFIKGTFDNEETVEEEWARPNAAIGINPIAGNKISDNILVPGPQPLPNALFTLEQEAKNDLNDYIGVDPLSMGMSEAAPRTAQATLAIDEFGKRRQRLYVRNIGFAMKRMGRVIIDFIQNYWGKDQNKIVRIINPQRQVTEETQGYILNATSEYFEDEELQRVGDLSVGKYDLIVVEGSTLPSNRWQKAQYYMEMFQAGIVDDIEVMKKTDIIDREGVIKRKSLLSKLARQNKELKEQLQESGQLITRLRTQEMTAEQKAELEKFKGRLKESEVDLQKSANAISAELEKAVRNKENGQDREKKSK